MGDLLPTARGFRRFAFVEPRGRKALGARGPTVSHTR
jgi:hypothetical protein